MSIDVYSVVPLAVERNKKKTRTKDKQLKFKIEWITLLTGFFLARGLLLNELLPFGIGFLAANRRHVKRMNLWPLFGVLLGLASLGPVASLFPYYINSITLWFFSSNKKVKKQHGYWIVWIFASFLLLKAPFLVGVEYSPMTWITAFCEALIAIATYSIAEPVIQRKMVKKLAAKEIQIGLLLGAILLGAEILVVGLELRVLIMFYLVFAAARLGGLSLTTIVGPSLLVISLVLGFPQDIATLLVVVALAAGLLHKIPGGLFVGGFAGFLLTLRLPIVADNIPFLLAIITSGVLAYLTPRHHLRKLETIIPRTDRYIERQEAHCIRVQAILEDKIKQLSQIFLELAGSLDGNGFIRQQLVDFANIVEQLGVGLGDSVVFAETIEETLWQRLDCKELSELTVLQTQDGFEIIGKRQSRCGSKWCNKIVAESELLLEIHLQVHSRNCANLGKCGFTIGPKAYYKLDVKTAKLAQGRVSGDSESVFQLAANKVGLLISDGMGIGEDAASDSLATIRLLEKMTKIGFERELAVKVINQILLARNTNETFATIDLVVVDLQDGQLEFVKTGSAPSFIKRGRNVDVIQNHSLPIGILNHIDIEPEKRQLNEGDYLIMVTDGIIEFQRDVVCKDHWLSNILRRVDNDLTSQEMASSILAQSLAGSGGQVYDDMMVIVAKIIRDDPEIYPYQRS